MTTFDYGPIEFYAIGFEGDRPGPGVLRAIDDLVVSGTVNVLDLVFVSRDPEGELTVLELSDTTDDDGVPALDLAGLASEEDIAELAVDVAPGTSAAILVVELLWAKAFAGALFDAGGAVLARQGIPAPHRQRIPVRTHRLKENNMMRRRGRPGLVGLAARTAVVAGTATAVSGGMQPAPGRTRRTRSTRRRRTRRSSSRRRWMPPPLRPWRTPRQRLRRRPPRPLPRVAART